MLTRSESLAENTGVTHAGQSVMTQPTNKMKVQNEHWE